MTAQHRARHFDLRIADRVHAVEPDRFGSAQLVTADLAHGKGLACPRRRPVQRGGLILPARQRGPRRRQPGKGAFHLFAGAQNRTAITRQRFLLRTLGPGDLG